MSVLEGEHIRELRRLGACQEALDWARDKPDLQTSWDTCKQGDWMLWLAARVGVGRTRLLSCAVRSIGQAEGMGVIADPDTFPAFHKHLSGMSTESDLWQRAYHAWGAIFELGEAAEDVRSKSAKRKLLKGAANVVREELPFPELQRLLKQVDERPRGRKEKGERDHGNTRNRPCL